MSERLARLTDDDLQAIDALSDGRDGTGASRLTTRMMLAELRARRAADLSAEDMEALLHARVLLDVNTRACRAQNTDRALSVLDRILAGQGGGR